MCKNTSDPEFWGYLYSLNDEIKKMDLMFSFILIKKIKY